MLIPVYPGQLESVFDVRRVQFGNTFAQFELSIFLIRSRQSVPVVLQGFFILFLLFVNITKSQISLARIRVGRDYVIKFQFRVFQVSALQVRPAQF